MGEGGRGGKERGSDNVCLWVYNAENEDKQTVIFTNTTTI